MQIKQNTKNKSKQEKQQIWQKLLRKYIRQKFINLNTTNAYEKAIKNFNLCWGYRPRGYIDLVYEQKILRTLSSIYKK
jgi:hypothetical protein